MPQPKTAIAVHAIPPFRDTLGRFSAAEKGLRDNFRNQLRSQGRRLFGLTKEEAPVKTGDFKAGHRWRTVVGSNKISIFITSPQPLGKFIVGGTKAHAIAAKHASMLRFYWPRGYDGARVYFFKAVWHPGTKPNRYTGRAYRRWLPGARVFLNRIARDFVRDFTGN